MYIVTNERRMERRWRFHAQLEARLYTWRGATLRGVLKPWVRSIKHPDRKCGVPEWSWSFQRTTTCIWMPDVRLLHYFEPTQWGSVSGLDDGKRKTKRGWSPGDSLNLVRVLSVRVNYSQQCRNDINGRWEYSKSIMFPFDVVIMLNMSLNPPQSNPVLHQWPVATPGNHHGNYFIRGSASQQSEERESNFFAENVIKGQ